MTDFRALCEELANSVELLLEMRQCARPMQITEDCLNRARAALAEPPSLKEQALDALREAESTGCLYVNGRSDLIRRALEQLNDE